MHLLFAFCCCCCCFFTSCGARRQWSYSTLWRKWAKCLVGEGAAQSGAYLGLTKVRLLSIGDCYYPAVRTGSSNTHFFFRGFFFFLVVTCPRPPVFARPKKYLSCLSLHSQGLLSWVTVTYFTPPGEGEQRRGLMPLGLFLFKRYIERIVLQVKTGNTNRIRRDEKKRFNEMNWTTLLTCHVF